MGWPSIVKFIWLLIFGKIDDSKARLSGCLKVAKVTVLGVTVCGR
jgi:hypothetical protein